MTAASPLGSPSPDLEHRIVTLIPSATEIVAVLGLASRLVGRSHECDYPESVRSLPVCTRPKFDPIGTSREVHERVSKLLATALSVYEVDLAMLEQLAPTHILTQAQCEVCAVSLSEVEAAVAGLTGGQPHILSLQPNVLSDLWEDIARVGTALGVPSEHVIQALRARVKACCEKAQSAGTGRRIACIEWTDPLMAAGNWVPELVEMAGGVNLFGTTAKHSPWLEWTDLAAADPEVIILMPCGYDLDATREATLALARSQPEWTSLSAVREGEVFIVDGNQYFNRPGPRLVDSLEILAEILHPGLFAFSYAPHGWQRL
ncbi:MAG: cobalamin-binding protein [Aphanocapsa lilacina HA4352-LM1]|nr:cobalamin-binding protein [Aphanocapsa lilacina HA4352-LM1]